MRRRVSTGCLPGKSYLARSLPLDCGIQPQEISPTCPRMRWPSKCVARPEPLHLRHAVRGGGAAIAGRARSRARCENAPSPPAGVRPALPSPPGLRRLLDRSRNTAAEFCPERLASPIEPIDERFAREDRGRRHRQIRLRFRPLLELNLAPVLQQATARSRARRQICPTTPADNPVSSRADSRSRAHGPSRAGC